MSSSRLWGLGILSVLAAAGFAGGVFTKITTTATTPVGRALSAALYHVTPSLLCAVLAAYLLGRRAHERVLAALCLLVPFGFGYSLARVPQLQNQIAQGSHLRPGWVELWPRVAGLTKAFIVLSILEALLAAVLAWVARQGRGYAAVVGLVLALLGGTEVGITLQNAWRETVEHRTSQARLDPVTTVVDVVLIAAAVTVVAGIAMWATRNQLRQRAVAA